MSHIEDDGVSFCLTVSRDIDLPTMLMVLGKVEELPEPQMFDDFPEESYIPGEKGLLNVFEEGDFLATLENTGFLGVARRTLLQLVDITKLYPGHYVCIYKNVEDNVLRYVEVQDGEILADFDPRWNSIPVIVEDFFPRVGGSANLLAMVSALEYRLEPCVVRQEWFEHPTTTYLIDYSNRNY